MFVTPLLDMHMILSVALNFSFLSLLFFWSMHKLKLALVQSSSLTITLKQEERLISLLIISYDLYISLISVLARYKYCLCTLKVDDVLMNRPLRFITAAIHHCDPDRSAISPVPASISGGDRKQSCCTRG